MAVFSVRVPDDLARRFDGVAGLSGGRSAMLRRLIEGAAAGRETPAQDRPERRDAARLMVRLAAPEAARVAAEAQAMGLRRAGWVAALVRRWTRGRPTSPARTSCG